MGKIVVTEFISLDGVFEDPGGAEGYQHGGWSFTFNQGEEGGKFKLDELMAADAQLLGRLTYEGFAKAWPAMEDPVGFADKMNGMPKYVVSATLTDPAWNNTTVLGSTADAAGLKDQYQGDILIAGSGQLVRGLTGLGLVDEYRLMVFPLILGTGQRLFDGAQMTRLKLADVTSIGPDGVTIQRYVPA
ncbi:MAG: dihydrofolate reductase family protein [Streptosporangiaceae bacterium]